MIMAIMRVNFLLRGSFEGRAEVSGSGTVLRIDTGTVCCCEDCCCVDADCEVKPWICGSGVIARVPPTYSHQ